MLRGRGRESGQRRAATWRLETYERNRPHGAAIAIGTKSIHAGSSPLSVQHLPGAASIAPRGDGMWCSEITNTLKMKVTYWSKESKFFDSPCRASTGLAGAASYCSGLADSKPKLFRIAFFSLVQNLHATQKTTPDEG